LWGARNARGQAVAMVENDDDDFNDDDDDDDGRFCSTTINNKWLVLTK
jgi:hypothetical protein